MVSSEIENLIIKFFTHSATLPDLDKLESWIQDPANQVIFKDYVRTHFAITLGMNDPDLNKISKKLIQQIRQDKKISPRKKTFSLLKYAAIIILSMGLGYYLQQGFLRPAEKKAIVPGQTAITLQLDNGQVKVISENGSSSITDAKGKIVGVQQGKKLIYDKNRAERELLHNTLKVPYGRRFNLVLSDGTEVFLNAGSSIKYPVHFLPGQKRQVFLEGEAFFDVAHDRENPFLVNVNEIKVEVYGTQFNISNYPEDNDTEVVLLKGSVGLTTTGTGTEQNGPILLKPGFKGAFDKTEKVIDTQKVNPSMYTSWMTGDMVFRDTPFENIVQKLERQYNVTIVNNNEKLAKERFNATIETQDETIEQVMGYFNKIYQIEYTIVENKIIIN